MTDDMHEKTNIRKRQMINTHESQNKPLLGKTKKIITANPYLEHERNSYSWTSQQ